MKTGVGNLQSLIRKAAASWRVRSTMFWVLGLLFVLQLYFVRELLAAELLFGMAFAALLALGGLFYVLGALGERGFGWTEAGVRVLAASTRRGFSSLEEISRKAMRAPRSESAHQ
jgi:hypothetical protein